MVNCNALANALRSADEKRIAWERAYEIPGQDKNVLRRDFEGMTIRWAEYGQKSDHGWEIDHITPIAIGGTDTFGNIRARHYRTNRAAGAILGNALASAGVRGHAR
jgi:hypothetical protein